MATHDYVISNASGAAVRADLNNALAAIVSNNSNATEPSTTYAYQWWADIGSSPAVMKLRNAANDGWITLFQLDGEWSTIALEDGTDAAPSLYFKDSGTDTGFFSGGTDQVNITTGGTERVEWGASEVVFNDGGENYDFRIEGDTNSSLFFVDASADTVEINGDVTITDKIIHSGDTNTAIRFPAADTVSVETGGSERCRVDDSGRLLVGTNTADTSGNALLQVNGSIKGTITSSTSVSSTSGTSIDFTGIPSWVKRITVMFNGVSTNGTSSVQIRLGTSGGVEATGYTESFMAVTGVNTCTTASSSTGFSWLGSGSGDSRFGHAMITNISGNIWTASVNMHSSSSAVGCGQGGKTLSGALDRVRITTVNGTDTFDDGTINILYEG